MTTTARITGAILDTITLGTSAILATIALAAMTTPTSAADILPMTLGIFAVTITSGTAKIVLNRRQTNDHHTRARN